MDQITLESQAEIIERWKAREGVTGRNFVPVNSGATRTPEKRALLQSLADTAAEQGTASPFSSNY
jgi:hypothetical protein